MMPNDAAQELLSKLGLPSGSASVLVWYDAEPPSLRVWVEERYFWKARQDAPKDFEGYRVDVEQRPVITAQRLRAC